MHLRCPFESFHQRGVVKITDRIPPFKRVKPQWATRPRRVETLAIMAGSAMVNKVPGPLQSNPTDNARVERAFKHGVAQFYQRTARMRRSLTRFTTTPDWEGLRNAHQGAHDLLK
jgi:hypothetical protein